MLRVTTTNLLPQSLSSSSPALSVLKLSSAIQTLTVSSSSSCSFLHIQKASRFHTFLSKPSIPTSSFLQKWAPSTVMSRSSPRAAASFSTQGSSGGDREILVQHLLVKGDDQEILVELLKLIAAGEDLGDLAAEYSMCPSKDEGGVLGWVKKGQMVPEFEEAAFSAPLNKVVRCKTKIGWHLLQVLSEREEARLQEIQPDEFHSRMQDPKFLEEAQLIDVREPDEIKQASLPDFQVLPLRQFGSWGPEITTKFDPQKDTYVMCHHGMRSLQIAKWLQSQGFRKVFNLTGGIHAYAVKVDPSIPTY